MPNDRQYMRLSAIVRMTRRSPEELLESLPPPSAVTVEDDAVCMWPISEVTALLPEMAKRDVVRLTHQRDELQETAKNLEKTVNDLKVEIDRLRFEMRSIRPVRDRIEESTKQSTDAYWPWESPMSAPRRVQGVYRLIQEGKTVYVGQSVHVMARVAEHAKHREFDQFSYAQVDGRAEALNEVESALIIIERPPWNHGQDGRLRHPTGQK